MSGHRAYNRQPGARPPGPVVPAAPEVLTVEVADDGRVIITRRLHGATVERLTLNPVELAGVVAMLTSAAGS